MTATQTTKVVETIKSVLLVVLLLITILLLCIFWGGAAFQNLLKSDLPRYEAINPIELLQPGRIEICFGGDFYTVTQNKFGVMMDCFIAFSEARNLSMEEITEERYAEVMRRPSIKAVFDYYLPFSALCEAYGIDRIPGSDGVDAVSELGYAVDFKEQLFVFDRKASKYYRIVGSGGNSFEPLEIIIAEAEDEAGTVSYVTLRSIMGGSVENDTLCPLSLTSDINDLAYYPESISGPTERPSDLVKRFFSDNFDFVRRIEQGNGTIIYMYGYGRIVVVAHASGILEFNREDDERAAPQLRFMEALELANSFIADHGGFETEAGTIFAPYIQEVIVDPDDKRGFRFVFGTTINGVRIYYENSAPMLVDVTGGRVSYFKRDFVNIDGSTFGNGESREVFSAMRMLAENIEYIGEALAEAGIVAESEISLEELIDLVTGFDCGYVRLKMSEGNLFAAWIVTIGGMEFYFDLDSGVML